MRCKGTTKAGTRCKRQVPEGAEYCVSHAGQAVEAASDQPAPPRDDPRRPAEGPPKQSPSGSRAPEDPSAETSKGDGKESRAQAAAPDPDEGSTQPEWFDLVVDGALIAAAVAAVLILGRWRR